MEDIVEDCLHQLNSSVLNHTENILTEGRVTVVSLALISLKNKLLEEGTDAEDVHRSLLAHLQRSAEEAVATIVSSESDEPLDGVIDECLFWSYVSHLAGLLSKELEQFIKRLKILSMKCHQLIVSYTTVAQTAGLTNQLQALHLHILQCLLKQLINYHWPLSHTPKQTADVQQLMESIQTLTVCHVICHAHQKTQTGTHTSEMMKETFQDLAAKIPVQLFSVYSSWLDVDKNTLYERSHMTSGGGVMKSVHLLVDTLVVIATVAMESGSVELKKSTVDCALRLVNNCWEEVATLARRVPKDLPLTMWYVVLSSVLWLHFQAAKMPIPSPMDNIKQESWDDLLRSMAVYCNGLRDDIISYHCQCLSSCVLQDSHSHDWSNTKPFYEGERCSFSVQMWHYHLCGLQHDLYTLIPVECFDVAEMILMSVLSSSLSHLSRRYSTTTPSYSRANQFKADILTMLYTTSYLLSCLPSNPHSITSRTLINRSCCHLLATLSLGGSSLEDIESCLSRRKPGMIAGMSVGAEFPLRMTKQHTKWMTYLEPTRSAIFGRDPPSPNMFDEDDDWISIVQCPLPSWPTLLQVLLSQGASLAVELCRCEGGETIIPHMAYLLSHCSHCEWALYTLYTALDGSRLIANGNQTCDKKSDTVTQWLVDIVTRALQSSMLSGVTSLHSNKHQLVPSLDHLELALATSIDGVESKLASQLPPAVMGCLWSLAAAAVDSSGDGRGAQLAKVIGLLLTSWIDNTLADCVSAPLVTTYLLAYRHLLLGTLPSPAEVKNIPQLHQLLCQPNLKHRISKFGSSLPTMSHDQPVMSHDQPSYVEHEIVAEIILSETKGQSLLKAVHKALKMKWIESNNDAIFDKKFNPFKTWSIKSRIRETQENVEWKSLIDSFTLHHLDKEMLTQLVYTVRWEFQNGAESLLEEREKQLVAAIQGHLCYHDDDCSV